MDQGTALRDPVEEMMERFEWRRRLALRLTRIMRDAPLAPEGDQCVRNEVSLIVMALQEMHPDDVVWVLQRLPQLAR